MHSEANLIVFSGGFSVILNVDFSDTQGLQWSLSVRHEGLVLGIHVCLHLLYSLLGICCIYARPSACMRDLQDEVIPGAEGRMDIPVRK